MFFRKHIDFSVGSWINDLLDVIGNEFLRDLTLETKDENKAVIVAKCLIKHDDITTYKKFIAVWKKHGGARADQFEQKLRRRIKNEGLDPVDDQFRPNS